MMEGTVITEKGSILVAKLATSGQALAFTRASVGTGIMPEGIDPAGLEGLVSYRMDGKISGYLVLEKEITVAFQVSSADVEEGFTITEAGLFAWDPDEGEILYAYLDLRNDTQYIYPKNGTIQKFAEIEFTTFIGRVEQITVAMNPGALVTKEMYDAGMAKKADLDGGDASDMVLDAVEPESQDDRYPDISPKSPVKKVFGYLYRWVKSLKADKVSISDLVDNCMSTDTDKAPTARQAKVLWDKIVDAVAALATHKSSADHDGRYYTEAEMDAKLDGKSNTNHGHSGMLTTSSLVDNCTSDATDKAPTARQAKLLWNKIVDAVSALATHKSSGDHDGRYYTESEINTKLGGKSDTSHNHDGAYVKKDNVAEVSGIKVGNKATDGYGWIDIFFNKLHNYSIYPEMTKLIFKSLHSGPLMGFDFIGAKLMAGGSEVITFNRIVDNCTSNRTDLVPTAKQAKLLMDNVNQLNSDLGTIKSVSFTYASGFSNCDSNWKTQCWRIGKVLYAKINCKRNATIGAGSSTNILTLDSSLGLYGDFQFTLVCGTTPLIGTVYANRTVNIFVPSPHTLSANDWIQGYFMAIVG